MIDILTDHALIYLKSKRKVCGLSTSLLDDIVNTPAGNAFKSFLQAFKEEEGHQSIRWGPNLQEENTVMVFISTSKQRSP